MCELLGMASDLPTTLSLSITKLAEHGGPPTSIRDGWGIAYYEGADVRLIKDAQPADDSDRVRFVWDHDLRSSIAMAHIRRATVGEPAYRNTQPFAHRDRCKQASTGKIEPPALVFLQRWCRQDKQGLLASVALSEDPWQDFAEGEVIAISHGRVVSRRLDRLHG